MQKLRDIYAALVAYGRSLIRSICWPFKAAGVGKKMSGRYDGAVLLYCAFRVVIWSSLVASLFGLFPMNVFLAAMLVADFIHVLIMAEVSHQFPGGLTEFAKASKKTWTQAGSTNAT